MNRAPIDFYEPSNSNGAAHRAAWTTGPPPGRFEDAEAPSGVEAANLPKPTAGELVRARIGQVPPRRVPAGLATLDAITRGGLPEGRVVLLGGAPGAGKTTLAMQLAIAAARAGWSAMALVADGSTEDVLQRFAQLEGFTREEFEANDPEALELLAERLDKLEVRVLDTDSCGSLEEASDALKTARGDRPSLLVVDSVQTVRSRASEFADGARARLDANTTALKRCARSDGHLVVATSELARGAYRSKNAAEQIDDLAAFKESGALEYAADLALVLRSVKNEEDFVDVTVPKSRIGMRSPFRLMLDRRHMRFGETDRPVEDDRGTPKARFAKTRTAILAACAGHQLTSANQVYREIGGTKTEVLAAVRELLEDGSLVRFGALLRPGSTGSESAEPQ